MDSKTRNFLAGAGGILDIMPPRRRVDFSSVVSRETQAQRMANAWNRVGSDIRQAMRALDHEVFRQAIIRSGGALC